MSQFSNPAGPDAQINSTTANEQLLANSRRAIAISGTGESVVVWQSFGQDGSRTGVIARRLDAAGQPQGTEILVNQTTVDTQESPAIAMDALGNFVVVWESYSETGQNDIYARRFNADGTPSSNEFLVNALENPLTSLNQQSANVAMTADGGFVVTWTSINQDGGGQGIYARRFNADGTPSSNEFLVNTTTANDQRDASIAVGANGDFVIAWTSNGQVNLTDVYFQRFSADGTPQGGETLVNQVTTNLQQDVSVAIASNGDFVLSWSSINQDSSGWGIYARSYSANGTPKGDEFLVNSTLSGDQQFSSVTMMPDGNFVVTWTSPDGGNVGIYARRYSDTGIPQSKEFLVNSITAGIQRNSSVALETDGDAVFVWTGPDASSTGIFSRRFNLSELPTTSGIPNLTLPENSDDFIIDLNAVFADRETPDANLIYTLLPVTNSALFRGGSPNLNTATGELTLDFAADTFGFSDLTLLATDQDGLSVETTFRLTLTQVSDPPVVEMDSSPIAYTENAPALTIDSSLTVTDRDSTELSSATVTITNFAAGDVLSVDRNLAQTYGLSVNYSGGVLTISGTAPVLQYQGLLRTLAYRSTSENPTVGDRTISVQVNDGMLNSNSDTRIVAVTAVNDAPVVTVTSGNTTYTEGDPAVAIDPSLTVADVDSTNLNGATVTITNFVAGEDLLSVTAPAGITSTFSNGVLTLSGVATVAEYETVLQSLTYRNSSSDPTLGDRTIRIAVNDGQLGSTPVNRTVRVIPVNDAPIVTLANTTITYTENQAALLLDGNLNVSDSDSSNLTSATITITNFAAGDVLDVTIPSGVSISKTFSNGVLTLSGTATVSTYQDLLRSITYRNPSENPSGGDRTIRIVVNDEFEASTPVERTITVVPVNDAPVVTASGSTTYSENSPGVAIANALTLSDVDSDTITSATVTIANFVAGQDELFFTSNYGISGEFNNGVLTLTGTATIAQFQEVLRSVSYRNSSDNPSLTSRTIQFTVNEGNLNSNTATRTVAITASNDAPSVTFGTAAPTYTENGDPVVVDSALTLSDPDNTTLSGATVTITNYVAGQDFLSVAAQSGITSNFSNGVLTLSGVATIAQYETLLRSITYRNSSDNPDITPRVLQFTVSDGTASSPLIDRTVNVTATNDAPQLSTSAGSANYTEGTPAVVVDRNLAVSDIDSTNLASATVTISNYAGVQDVLSVTEQFGITSTYSNGVLTLTGAATIAQYQTVLRSVTYRNSSNTPATDPRILQFKVNDGSLDSNQGTRTVNVVAADDAPLVTITDSTATYSENAPGVTIAPTLTVSDADSSTLTGATVTLANAVAGQDFLNFIDQAGISGTYSNGVLTLTGTASVGDYQTALRSITYSNSSENPNAADRTIQFTVSDGSRSSLPVSQTVSVQPVNDAPTLTGSSGSLVYTENNPGLVIDNSLLVADVDSATLSGATVRISSNYVAGQDFLNFTNQAGISGAYSNGVLTLTGVASLADYQTALRSIAYFNSSDNPDPASRTIEFQISDGTLSSSTSSRIINISSTPEAPIVTLTAAPLSYTEAQGATVIDAAVTLDDLDSPNLQSATVRITNFAAGEDVLNFTAPAGFSSTYSNGILTITGTGTLDQYQTLLRSITYTNTSTNPNTTARTIEFQVNDGGLNSSPATRTIEINAINSPPVLTASTGTASYTENAVAVAIDPTLTLSDPDSSTIARATVSITSATSQDLLDFTNQAGITGSYSNGVLTLTGSASLADYQTALRSITYRNSSDNPTAGDRTIQFVVNDGTLASNSVTRTVTVTPVNDAPTLTSTAGTASFTEGGTPIVVDEAIALSDLDSSTIASAMVTITNFVEGQDVLNFTPIGGIGASFNAQSGALTLSGVASIADYQAALRQVTYSNTSTNPTLSDRIIAFTANDGELTSIAATRRVTIQALNNAPVVTPTSGTLTYVEDAPAIAIAANLSLTDADSANLNRATVTITNFAAEDVLEFTNQNGITGSFSNGVLTLTGTATVANYQTALQSITYRNSSDTPTATARSLQIVVNDGTRDSDAVTRTIQVTPTNDAPIVTPTAGTALYSNSGPVAIDSTLQVNDADSPNLSGAIVRIRNFIAGQDQLSFTNAGSITGSFDSDTGTLRLSGTASANDYQAALRSVTYRNLSSTPVAVDRQIEFQVNDGQLDSTVAERYVQFDNFNRPPQITVATTAVTFTENGTAVAIDPTLRLSDPDSPFISSATVSIGGYVAGEDSLNFENQNNIFGSFNRTTGVLSLRGPAAIADFEAALRSITYINSSDTPSPTERTLQFSLSDGESTSATVTRSLKVIAVNDAPVVNVPGDALVYTASLGRVQIAPGLALSDADSSSLSGATVTIDGFVSGQDQLSFTNQNGIQGSFSNGVLTLTGAASIAAYQTALQSISYTNTSATPDGRLRTLSIRVNDGTSLSSAGSRPLQVVANNNAPVIDLNGPIAGTDFATVYQLGNPPVRIVSAGLSLNDADSPTIASAVVAIANPLNWPSERLEAATAGTGITAEYNPAGGRLTLIGAAPRSTYQQVLRSITYSNSDPNADPTARTIVFTVDDGDFTSNLAVSTVTFGTRSATPIQGTPEIDNLVTTGVTDRINALSGDDTVTSTLAHLQQDDSIDGGTGTDTLVITDGTGELVLNLGNADNQLTGAIAPNTRIFNFERFDLRQFAGNTTQTGSDTDDVLMGSLGRNVINGGAGNDTITGNSSSDTLDSGTGSDTLTGRAGDDFYRVDSSGDRIVEAADGGLDIVEASTSYTLSANVENLTLVAQAATATGNASNNILTGNSSGNTIAGGSGNDTLLGNGGNDVLAGEAGDDLLSGGEGRDRLSGGEGRDRFGLTLTRSSRDVITDFSSADDTVSIAIGSVKKIKIGGLLRRQFKLGRAAGDRDDRFIYNRGSGALFFDADGSGRRGAIQIASFTNRPTLTAADIVITR